MDGQIGRKDFLERCSIRFYFLTNLIRMILARDNTTATKTSRNGVASGYP